MRCAVTKGRSHQEVRGMENRMVQLRGFIPDTEKGDTPENFAMLEKRF